MIESARRRERKKDSRVVDLRIVKISQKGYCDKAWVKKKNIADCGFFYVYDATRLIHICSFTASHELWPIHEYATFTKDVSDEIMQEVDEALRESEEPCCYVNVSDVARWPSIPAVQFADVKEDADEDDEAFYMRLILEAQEYYCGNPVWFTKGKP